MGYGHLVSLRSSLLALRTVVLIVVASSKRPPAGYTPFVAALVEQNQVQEALRYVAKVQDKTDRTAFAAYIARLPNQDTANQLMDRLNE